MVLTDQFSAAFEYALAIHSAQSRKGTDIPYISHLMIVSGLIVEAGGDEDQAIAGLLHDAAEDQGGPARLNDIRGRFGDGVASIVADCTDAWEDPKPEWKARKDAYLSSLAGKPQRSLLVSLADKVHNAEAILSDYRRLGESFWSRFTGGKLGTLWYYRSLSDTFLELVPGTLSERLRRAIDELSELSMHETTAGRSA